MSAKKPAIATTTSSTNVAKLIQNLKSDNKELVIKTSVSKKDKAKTPKEVQKTPKEVPAKEYTQKTEKKLDGETCGDHNSVSHSDSDSECGDFHEDFKTSLVINKALNLTYNINLNGASTTYYLKRDIVHRLSPNNSALKIANTFGVTVKLAGHNISVTGNTNQNDALIPVIHILNSEEVTIDSDKIFAAAGTRSYGLLIENSNKIYINGLFIQDNVIGIQVRNSTEVYLNGVRVNGIDAAVYVENSSVKVDQGYFFAAPNGNQYGIAGFVIYNPDGATPRRSVSIKNSEFINNDVFAVEFDGFKFTKNISNFSGVVGYIYGQLQIGQGFCVENESVNGGFFPSGTGHNFKIENNIFIMRNNGVATLTNPINTGHSNNIIINRAVNGSIKNNSISNNARLAGAPTANPGASTLNAATGEIINPLTSKILIGKDATSGIDAYVNNVVIEDNVLSGDVNTITNIPPGPNPCPGIRSTFTTQSTTYGIIVVGENRSEAQGFDNPSVTNITIQNNKISDSSFAGVYVSFAAFTTIKENVISAGSFGIVVDSASISTILRNNEIYANVGISIGNKLTPLFLAPQPRKTLSAGNVTNVVGLPYVVAVPAEPFTKPALANFEAAPYFNIIA